ncbi:MAG: DUF447 family protein [Pirellulales bacterium]
MIVEGLCTTVDLEGRLNLAPLGPIVEGDFESLILRPFPGSKTYENLKARRRCVFHVTDDAATMALAAIDQLDDWPPCVPVAILESPEGSPSAWDVPHLVDCVRWYALELVSWDESGPRPVAEGRVVASGRERDFWGFNRARHALIETAILATRLAWHSPEEIARQLDHCRTVVNKTGGPAELLAFDRLHAWISARNGGA